MTTRPSLDSVPHPEGFERMPSFGGAFIELVGPMYYSLASPATVLGLRVEEKHRNGSPKAAMHGGMLATFIDTASTWAARHSQDPHVVVVTTNMSTNFVGNASPGDWIEARVEVLKTGRRAIFTNCLVLSDGKCIAQAGAQFLVVGESPPGYPTYRRSGS